MSQSPLVDYAAYTTTNCNVPRNQKIEKITVHHAAGILSVEGMANIIHNPSREVSCNYAIGYDGRIGGYIKEENRSWCSSSPWNDNRAITIEVSNCATTNDWPVSDNVWTKLVNLCVDICKRNNIPKLTFTGDQNGSLTFHYMFTSTSCLPIDRTELLTPTGWKLLKDITYEDKVATVQIDNLGIVFDDILGIIPVKTQDTYVTRDFEATSDHRVLYSNQPGRKYIGEYKDLHDKYGSLYFHNAGNIENPKGLGLSLAEIEFLAAVQADGSYMRDGDCLYGVEFHFSKERKITRIKDILISLRIPYTVTNQTDGTVKIRIYGADYVASCEKYLKNKCFTWEWLNMTDDQFEVFYNAILFYDGCMENKSYSSSIKENIDIVQAIVALHNIGSKVNKEHDRIYFKSNRRSLGENINKRKPRQEVSCVTVRSGFILIRQHGRTIITGNCPGPYIKSRAQLLCDQVNSKLNSSKAATQETPSTPVGTSTRIEAGNWVKIKPGSTYWGGMSIPSWVMDDVWKVTQVSGKRAVLGENDEQDRNINSPINVDCLINMTVATPEGFTSYKKSLKTGSPIFKDDLKTISSYISADGVFTIIEEKKVDKTIFGKLKSGAGWVVTTGPVPNDINVGDFVKVLKNVQYNGMTFKVYEEKYKVLQVNGDRVVISSDGKNVTAAVNKNNLQKV